MLRKITFARWVLGVCLLTVGCLSIQGCNSSSTSTTEDSSASGSVASLLGGTYNTSESSGTVTLREEFFKHSTFSAFLDLFNPSIRNAMATILCPTFQTASGSGTGSCSVVSSTMTLDYGTGCQFSNSGATWTGSQTLTVSTGSPTCGTFPAAGSYTGTLTRLFPATTTRTSASGVVVTVDTSGTDSGYNFTSPASAPSGGAVVTFSGGNRTQIAFPGINLIAKTEAGVNRFNHSITTSGGSPISLSGASVTGGSVLVYHNLLKVLGTTTFTNVEFTAGCCTPTAGTITTSFAAVSGTTPTTVGEAFVNKSETLEFTGCGTATYTGPESYSGDVTLGHCF